VGGGFSEISSKEGNSKSSPQGEDFEFLSE